MDRRTQAAFIPAHSGQPSALSAWTNPLVDSAAGGFYRSTLATMEQSWVRPRFPGYVPFQTAASTLIRHALASGDDPETTLDTLDDLYRTAHATASAERSAAS
jgi:multiple sugar transport system substrate-binding protein